MASYTSKVIAVLGRTVRAGRWKVAEDSLVIALFGRCVLDLTRAYVDPEDEDLSMNVFALFGSVTIELPAGCDVEPSGIAIVASSEVEIPSERSGDITKATLAPLDISWFALFAHVRIAEVDRTAPEPSPAVLVGRAEVGALPPPAVEVFDSDPGASAAIAAAATSVEADPEPIATTEPASDPESEAASLRDEIAAWRAESGRTKSASAEVDPEDEILDESDDGVDEFEETADDAILADVDQP